MDAGKKTERIVCSPGEHPCMDKNGGLRWGQQSLNKRECCGRGEKIKAWGRGGGI